MWFHVLKRRHSIFKLPSFSLCFLSDARDDRKAPNIVLAVSNGLLLSTATRGWHDCYYICNPFTKQWSALPKPPRIHKWVWESSFNLLNACWMLIIKRWIFNAESQQWALNIKYLFKLKYLNSALYIKRSWQLLMLNTQLFKKIAVTYILKNRKNYYTFKTFPLHSNRQNQTPPY